jgi:large subunit ribosomal protein L18
MGLITPIKGCRVYAALKGAIDAGLNLPASEEAFPSPERLSGKHVADYAGKLGEEGTRKRFSAYLQRGINPADIVDLFEKTKASIGQEFGSGSGKE